jgi:enoyl-[acyl-carrier protein] reductase II
VAQLLLLRYPSNAGGLGTLGPNAGAADITTDVELTGDRLREQIIKVRTATRNTFAVNIPIGNILPGADGMIIRKGDG